MKCFYHDDLDGHCAGAIVKMAHPDIEMFEMSYSIDFPFHIIDKDEVVYMVDFSLPVDQMREVMQITKKFIWIDHHSSIIQDMELNRLNPVGLRIREGISGCELTWRYLYGNSKPPICVTLIGSYDIWSHKAYPDVLPFFYGLQAKNHDPAVSHVMDVLWLPLLAIFSDGGYSVSFTEDLPLTDKIIREGKVIKRYVDRQRLLNSKRAFEVKFEGFNWIVLNTDEGSLALNDVYNPQIHDGMMTFIYSSGDGGFKVGLYTDTEPSTPMDLNCGELAKRFGGGGHKNAAGFKCRELPWEEIFE